MSKTDGTSSSSSSKRTTTTTTLFAFDFDGVLVDSAAETGISGWLAAKILWPDAPWILASDNKEENQSSSSSSSSLPPQPPLDVIERFRRVRPCLETGWEASLIIRLLADPKFGQPSNDDIVQEFQSVYKERILEDSKLTPEECNDALKQARNDWIAQNEGKGWIQAHGFFEGACQAVRKLLEREGSDNVYIITTKAKEFALRLLEQQQLYDSKSDTNNKNTETTIPYDHIYGLGSGPKALVLTQLLSANDSTDCVAMMVEDNLLTLHKIVATPELQGRVLPVLASWGYNTSEQQQEASDNDHFVVLDAEDSSSLSRVLDSTAVPTLVDECWDKRNIDNENKTTAT